MDINLFGYPGLKIAQVVFEKYYSVELEIQDSQEEDLNKEDVVVEDIDRETDDPIEPAVPYSENAAPAITTDDEKL